MTRGPFIGRHSPKPYVSAHYNLERILQMRGETTQAGRLFRTALRYDLTHARAHNNLAVCVAAEQKYDKAKEHYGEAIRLEPDYILAFCSYGNLLARESQLREAEVPLSRGACDVNRQARSRGYWVNRRAR